MHLCVKRGMSYLRVDDALPPACVVAHVKLGGASEGSAALQEVCVVALHLPSGEKYAERRGADRTRAMEACCGTNVGGGV